MPHGSAFSESVVRRKQILGAAPSSEAAFGISILLPLGGLEYFRVHSISWLDLLRLCGALRFQMASEDQRRASGIAGFAVEHLHRHGADLLINIFITITS